MPFKTIEKTKCDVLVIGSGGAGLRAAIAAATGEADVLMVSKARIGHATNTYLSKGIIAASGWGDPADTSVTHGQDTIQGGRMLNDPNMVSRFTEAIRTETRQIREWGVAYIPGPDKAPAVMKFPGHGFARHIICKNWKGSDLVMPLKKKAVAAGVRFEERMFVSSLMAEEDGIAGAMCVSADGRFLAIEAKAVVLATGGFGQVYLNTNNAPGITGDGHALAGRLGVALQDMEFVQYYPTARGNRGSRILLSERILVQEGVALRNSRGEDILKKNGFDSPKDITRDQLARVIMKEILEDAADVTTVNFDLTRLSPGAAEELAVLLPSQWSRGQRVFPIAPTTHFCMGGVVVDDHGETSCKGLYAAGEVVAGAHGANRLGGNALAEIIAMGSLVGKTAVRSALARKKTAGFDALQKRELTVLKTIFAGNESGPKNPGLMVKKTMWMNAGIVRNRESLERALNTLSTLKDVRPLVTDCTDLIRLLEFRNMQFVGEVVCTSALERTETRGSHFRSDFLEEDQAWLVNIRIRHTPSGLAIERVPVPASSHADQP
jgi:succinate dehydrogenase/fumarate reductase flavoprotein subunit